MRHLFLNKEPANKKLILIFGGWAADERIYTDMAIDGWDLLLCYEYDNLDFDESLLHNYSTIYLFAWSLGVFIADRSLKDVRLARAVAINGTLTPVDDNCGIPTAIFMGTADNLNQPNLLKFARRIFTNKPEFEQYRQMFEQRTDISDMQQQLYLIAKESVKATENHISWTDVLCSENDRIFPIENQLNFWQKNYKSDTININKISAAHYIDFKKIIRQYIIDNKQVKKHFERSTHTYNDNAYVQCEIAQNLIDLIKSKYKNIPKKPNHALEIGSGTGIATALFINALTPNKITLVDLCHSSQNNIFAISSQSDKPTHTHNIDIEYIQADAERWITENCKHQKYDIIFSSSTVQWFNDPYNFIKECSMRINDQGLLALSTFGPNNLKELNPYRQATIRYKNSNEWQKIATDFFADVETHTQEIVLQFDTVSDLLRHLKLTGVTAAGTHHSISNVREILRNMQSDPKTGKFHLTYSIIYLISKLRT